MKYNLFAYVMVFLLVLTPLALADSYRAVRVSDLQEGDVVVDSEGNEVVVESVDVRLTGRTLQEVVYEMIYGSKVLSGGITGQVVYYEYTGLDGNKGVLIASSTTEADNLVGSGITITTPFESKSYTVTKSFQTADGGESNKEQISNFITLENGGAEFTYETESGVVTEILSPKEFQDLKSNGALKRVKPSEPFNSRPDINTKFGELPWLPGNLVQGLEWSLFSVGAVQVFGRFLGAEEEQINTISASLTAGILAGKLTYGLLGKAEGANNLIGDGKGFDALFSNKGLSIGVGAGVAWLVYTSMFEDKSTFTRDVQFECLPWQAPIGSGQCELCNEDNLPCSEYRCKSLGQNCLLVNEGTENVLCVDGNPNDVNPPVIEPLEEALSPEYEYANVKLSPPGAGFNIERTDGADGCIKAFTPLEFGIKTDEPSQCKIDIARTESYEEMSTFFGGDNTYAYNHTEYLTLPGASEFENASFELENGNEMNLYIRCQDGSGNVNSAEYAVQFCVDPSPDTTPPQIKATSIESNSCVPAETDSAIVEFYTDEPAECSWSFEDQDYDSMPNQMSCLSGVTQINALQLYTCRTNLTGIPRDGTEYFVRCKDQPSAPENDRNENVQSYEFSLKGSNPLKMKNLRPNETIYGSVNPAPVELYAETIFGCEDRNAVCYYSNTGNDNSYVQFFDTDNEDGIHTQRLDLFAGEHTYYIKCVDAGGNVEINSTTFDLDIDTDAPVVARVYEEDEYLKFVTVRDAECTYTTNSCDFFFNEGTEMPFANSTSHIVDFDPTKTYYVKCRDEFRNEEAQCSVVVRPTQNFL